MGLVYSLREAAADKSQLGNKGANLVKMTRLELSVPPGFVVSLEAYKKWKETRSLPDEAIGDALASLEAEMNRKMGKGLEVSVRSSAPVSMPGMMDTILNIGDTRKMRNAIKSIFESWDNLRAVEYRRINNIPATLGTAAVVQAMVYGNRDEKSGTGVVFTRNPSTGDKGLFGEYLTEAQGEDLVSGARTPQPIEQLKSAMPKIYDELERLGDLINETMQKAFDNTSETTPFRHNPAQGFSIKIGPDGKPRIRKLNDRQSLQANTEISDNLEPLVDLIEEGDMLVVLVALPGVNKDDLDLRVTANCLTVSVDTAEFEWYDEFKLPVRVKSKSARASYKNGVLEVKLEKEKIVKDNKISMKK